MKEMYFLFVHRKSLCPPLYFPCPIRAYNIKFTNEKKKLHIIRHSENVEDVFLKITFLNWVIIIVLPQKKALLAVKMCYINFKKKYQNK